MPGGDRAPAPGGGRAAACGGFLYRAAPRTSAIRPEPKWIGPGRIRTRVPETRTKSRPLPRSGKYRKRSSPDLAGRYVPGWCRETSLNGTGRPMAKHRVGLWPRSRTKAELWPRVSTAQGRRDPREKKAAARRRPLCRGRKLSSGSQRARPPATFDFPRPPAPGGPLRARQYCARAHTYGRPWSQRFAAAAVAARHSPELPAAASANRRRHTNQQRITRGNPAVLCQAPRSSARVSQVARGPGLLRSPDPCGVGWKRPVDGETACAVSSSPGRSQPGPRATCDGALIGFRSYRAWRPERAVPEPDPRPVPPQPPRCLPFRGLRTAG
jgi:hypothetical protein